MDPKAHTEIERIFTFFQMSEQSRKSALGLEHFSGAEPLTEGFITSAEAHGVRPAPAEIEGDILIDGLPPLAHARPDYLRDRLDYAYVGHTSDKESQLAMVRVRLLNHKQARGYQLQRYMGELSTCRIDLRTATFSTTRTIHGSQEGVSWVPAKGGPQQQNGHPKDDDLGHFFQAGCALQLAREKTWRVHLGYVNYPTLSFVTDPTGVLEVFRLRDIPNGAPRRAALRHWVEEHWRRQRECEVKVRAHLRGAQSFTWNGLRCRILPSAVDLDRAAQPKEEPTRRPLES